MDRGEFADFLRRRRETLQPEDVGLSRGTRRRTRGLRREEVAALVGMSSDYYCRLEQQRGSRPSEQMVAAIARGLHLSINERDHLFVLAGHGAPRRARPSDHVSPGLMRILARLGDTPAQVLTELGETLIQTSPCVALLGDNTTFEGLERSAFYRWFTDANSREIYPAVDHPRYSRIYAAELRSAAARGGRSSRAVHLADRLRSASSEFAELWIQHEIGIEFRDTKAFAHPELGEFILHCQVLIEPRQQQSLLVYTPTAGDDCHDKFHMLSVIGRQKM